MYSYDRRAAGLTDRERSLLQIAAKNPHGRVSVTIEIKNGTEVGSRERAAADSLVKKGLLEPMRGEGGSEPEHLPRGKIRRYVVFVFRITPAGRAAVTPL